jgi:hypothetical protein
MEILGDRALPVRVRFRDKSDARTAKTITQS